MIELGKTDEIICFREWIWSQGEIEPENLREFISFKNKVSTTLSLPFTKNVRWLASNISGIILPGIGGAVVSAIDKFILNRLFNSKGHVLFLNNLYPSIFK